MLPMPLTRTSSCNDSTMTDFSFKELLKRVGLQYKQSFAQVFTDRYAHASKLQTVHAHDYVTC